MAAIDQLVAEPGDDPVVRWRFEELLRACGDRVASSVLAREGAVDLHAAVALLRAGCPPKTALRILL